MLGVQPAFLRRLEAQQAVAPQRSAGGQRRYSRLEIDRIDAINRLLGEGMTVEGAKRIIELQTENALLREQLAGSGLVPSEGATDDKRLRRLNSSSDPLPGDPHTLIQGEVADVSRILTRRSIKPHGSARPHESTPLTFRVDGSTLFLIGEADAGAVDDDRCLPRPRTVGRRH